jgi:hypothetical protein
MKFKIILSLILGIFLILPLVSALDQSLTLVCGGDSELLIGCIGDDELIFLGLEVPLEIWSHLGGGAEHLTIPKEELPEVEEEIVPPWFSTLGFDKLKIKYSQFMAILCSSLFVCMFFMLIYIKKKKKKETKKFEKTKKEKI